LFQAREKAYSRKQNLLPNLLSKRKFLKKALVSGGSAEGKEASNQRQGKTKKKKSKKHSYITVTSELPSLHIFFINKQL
jgi:hypothetical protein